MSLWSGWRWKKETLTHTPHRLAYSLKKKKKKKESLSKCKMNLTLLIDGGTKEIVNYGLIMEIIQSIRRWRWGKLTRQKWGGWRKVIFHYKTSTLYCDITFNFYHFVFSSSIPFFLFFLFLFYFSATMVCSCACVLQTLPLLFLLFEWKVEQMAIVSSRYTQIWRTMMGREAAVFEILALVKKLFFSFHMRSSKLSTLFDGEQDIL